MSKSQTGFGNTQGSLGGMPSSSLKGKLASLEVCGEDLRNSIGRNKEDLQ
jgi:hypothetical protein